jgi:hypothetical protein
MSKEDVVELALVFSGVIYLIGWLMFRALSHAVRHVGSLRQRRLSWPRPARVVGQFPVAGEHDEVRWEPWWIPGFVVLGDIVVNGATGERGVVATIVTNTRRGRVKSFGVRLLGPGMDGGIRASWSPSCIAGYERGTDRRDGIAFP